jgi:hypothetical protein
MATSAANSIGEGYRMGTAFVISLWILEDVTKYLMPRRRISSRYDPNARVAPLFQESNRTYLLFAKCSFHGPHLTSYLLSFGHFPVF